MSDKLAATTTPAATAAPAAPAVKASPPSPPPIAPLGLPTKDDTPHDDDDAHHEQQEQATAGSSFFAFAKPYLDQAKPYVDRAAAQAKPYADAALQKANELKTKMDGTAATSPTSATGALPADPHAVAAPRTATSPTDKAKSAFGFGLASLQSAYQQVGAAIDAKTATPDKPGLFTQVSSAVQKGVENFNQAIVEPLNPNQQSASPYHRPGEAAPGTATATATAPTAAAAAPKTGATDASAVPPPAAGGATSVHPIVTTTNTVPHNNAAGDEALA